MFTKIESNYLEIDLKGERLFLLPQKAIYWERCSILLLADLHLGKIGHFRSNGIAVPEKVAEKNWELLHQLFQQFNPQRVYFLGDLFHSSYNKEWETFGTVAKLYPKIEFQLILGNHDILDHSHYQKLGFKVVEQLIEGPFLLTHEPIEKESKYYNIAGHIHPAVRLRGDGKQSHRVPCFYFGKWQGILPAFGAFTGMATIKTGKKDQVFVVVNKQVFKV